MMVELDHNVRGEETSITRKGDGHTAWGSEERTPMKQSVSRGCLLHGDTEKSSNSLEALIDIENEQYATDGTTQA